jgi:hypothetical protein
VSIRVPAEVVVPEALADAVSDGTSLGSGPSGDLVTCVPDRAELLSAAADPCRHRKNRGPFSASISSSGSVEHLHPPDAIASRVMPH